MSNNDLIKRAEIALLADRMKHHHRGIIAELVKALKQAETK